MNRPSILAASALFAGIMAHFGAAQAQTTIESVGLTIATTPAATTDYVFRGLSQTRGRPAVQLTIDAEHSSGVYVGAFASNVTFPGTNARQELDLLAGYRFAVGDLKLDVGAIYYTYPGYDAPTGGYELNFLELALRASYEIAPVKLVGLAAFSPNFTGESGAGYYVEGGFDMALDFGFTLAARAGYQFVERNFASANGNDGYFGASDYANASLTISREIFAGFTGALTGVVTSLDQDADCFGGSKVCDNRVILTFSRVF
jgi:uncharacterized protein (TIGR02001 family)